MCSSDLTHLGHPLVGDPQYGRIRQAPRAKTPEEEAAIWEQARKDAAALRAQMDAERAAQAAELAGGEDDLVRLLARVHALQAFVGTADGTNLLAGYKRAANILAIEEKKDGKSYSGQGTAMAGDPAEVDALVNSG